MNYRRTFKSTPETATTAPIAIRAAGFGPSQPRGGAGHVGPPPSPYTNNPTPRRMATTASALTIRMAGV